MIRTFASGKEESQAVQLESSKIFQVSMLQVILVSSKD
jgi:hypothetical protein